MTSLKKASDYIPFFADQKLDYTVGTPDRNKSMVTGSATLAAGSAAVLFADLGLPDMEDDQYQVLLASDGAVASWASKAATGFTISGTGTDAVDWMVVGRVAGQP